MSSPGSHAPTELPAVDERLVAPETRYEIDDGRLVYVPPSEEPHGNRHSRIAALLEAHVVEDFNVAIAMLTRTSQTSDVAPDVSVYPLARDPETGGRQLEHLAFVLVSTQSLAVAAHKASMLAIRGVRRVFAIDVERTHMFEWSRDLGTWSMLDGRSMIEDVSLAVPLPVEAMVRSENSDDAVARALLAKGNHVLAAVLAEDRAAARAQGYAEGLAEIRAEIVLSMLDSRQIHIPADERARILAERDLARLERWVVCAVSCESVADVLATL